MRRHSPTPHGPTGNGDGPDGRDGRDGGESAVVRRLVADIDRLTHTTSTTEADLTTLHSEVGQLRVAVETQSRTLADLADTLRTLPPPGHHTRTTATATSTARRSDPLAPSLQPPAVPADSPQPGDPGDPDGGGDGSDEGEAEAAWVGEWVSVVDPDEAVRLLAEVDLWVATVWSVYTPIPACWAWHPPVVAELLACQGLWVQAVHPQADPALIASWHDRWRPGTAHRLRRALEPCERTETHNPPVGGHYEVDPACRDELAAWWATTHARHPDIPPPGLRPLDRY